MALPDTITRFEGGAFVCGFATILGLKPVQGAWGVDWPSQIVGLTITVLACVVLVVLSLLFPDPEKEA